MTGVLDLRRLRYFLAIASEGSISAAARALSVAQPALSYHVAEMERLSGLTLFQRSREGIRLTPEGAVLRGHAAEIVARADAAERALEKLARKRPPARRLRIAIITSLAAELMPLLLSRTRETDRAPSLSIVEAGTRDIEARLKRGTIDMAVCLAPSPSVAASPIASERLLFIAPPGTTRKRRLPLNELSSYRLVLPSPDNPLRAHLEQISRDTGVDLDVVLEVDGPGSRYNAVVNGIGCTFLGATSVPASASTNGLCIIPVGEPELSRPIYLGYRKGLDPELMSSMREIVSSALGDLGLHVIETG